MPPLVVSRYIQPPAACRIAETIGSFLYGPDVSLDRDKSYQSLYSLFDFSPLATPLSRDKFSYLRPEESSQLVFFVAVLFAAGIPTFSVISHSAVWSLYWEYTTFCRILLQDAPTRVCFYIARLLRAR